MYKQPQIVVIIILHQFKLNTFHIVSTFHYSIKIFSIWRLFTTRLVGSISWFNFLTDKTLKWVKHMFKDLYTQMPSTQPTE